MGLFNFMLRPECLKYIQFSKLDDLWLNLEWKVTGDAHFFKECIALMCEDIKLILGVVVAESNPQLNTVIFHEAFV